jgi:hypothetical protein
VYKRQLYYLFQGIVFWNAILKHGGDENQFETLLDVQISQDFSMRYYSYLTHP